jgi:hypothetical protein
MIKKLSGDGTEEAQAKEIGVLLDQVKDTSTSMSYLLKVNNGAISYMAQQILSSNLHKGDDKDTPLGVIFKEANLLDQASKEFQAAIKTSLNDNQIKKANKGFFANLADSIFGSSPGVMNIAKESAEASFNGILELTPLEVGKFAMKMVNYGKEDEKASEQVEDEVNTANEDIQDDAAGPETETGDKDVPAEEAGDVAASDRNPVSKEDLLGKAKNAGGDAGEAIVKQMIGSLPLEDTGIKLENALMDRSLIVLSELSIPAEDYQDLVAMAIEDKPSDFEDVDTNELLQKLNDMFKGADIDIEIEKDPSAPEADIPDDVMEEFEETLQEKSKDFRKKTLAKFKYLEESNGEMQESLVAAIAPFGMDMMLFNISSHSKETVEMFKSNPTVAGYYEKLEKATEQLFKAQAIVEKVIQQLGDIFKDVKRDDKDETIKRVFPKVLEALKQRNSAWSIGHKWLAKIDTTYPGDQMDPTGGKQFDKTLNYDFDAQATQLIDDIYFGRDTKGKQTEAVLRENIDRWAKLAGIIKG